jgi:large subunit ribosomal protein L10
MSKQIKQMEMDALKETFKGLRDFVVLTADKLDCQATHQVRAGLRKKSIRLQMVKNSLARRVLDEVGVKLADCWQSPTLLAWGSNSLAELSKEIEALTKKYEKMKVKTAVSEGQEIPFRQALAMPTKDEALGRIINLAMSPAAGLLSQILIPAGQIAGQIKTLGERPSEALAKGTTTAAAS